MAVAMAVWSVGLHFSAAHNSFRALEKTTCSAAFLKASSGFAATKPFCILNRKRFSSSGTTIIPRAAPVTDVEDGNQGETDTIPTPVVIIDQDSDPDATVVEITFGDRLGALLDTANVFLDSSGKHNKFSITKA
ncbi:ACT domain-containing protein ACR11 [Spatholobus suberectus]|nr:ACT domain-containing protein ACR11 [Spatholobus suberectus]